MTGLVGWALGSTLAALRARAVFPGAQAGGPGLEPLPAEPPVSGPLWEIAVPAALFLLALVSTVLLYRHFAGDGE